MHQCLGRVPNEVRDGLLGVDAQQVLQNAQEGNLLRRLQHLLQDGVEDVQVGVEVDAVRARLHLRLI